MLSLLFSHVVSPTVHVFDHSRKNRTGGGTLLSHFCLIFVTLLSHFGQAGPAGLAGWPAGQPPGQPAARPASEPAGWPASRQVGRPACRRAPG